MLSNSEEVVKKAIQESDAPFLGLLGELFTPEIRRTIEIAVVAMPSTAGYLRYLEDFPALFAVNLSWHVMVGMGQSGHFELHPHIRKAMGVGQGLALYDAPKLWYGFRAALLRLGLEPSPRTSGPHYIVDEYLRQAGVPVAFVDDLAKRMLNFARRVGLPDEDDPEGVASWQAVLDKALGVPFSITARKAVALDSGGYYTRAFLRVHNGGGQATDSTNVLEQAMARAFQEQPASTSLRRATLPYIMFHDGNLGVFVPGGDDREVVVTVDDVVRTYRAGVEDRFIPVSETLPREVLVRDAVGRQSSQIALWDDDRPNRLLVFSESGRLKGKGQLAQAEPLILPPGSYTALSRFAPADVDAEELWEDPRLCTFSFVLSPGEKRNFSNGPASLLVQGESQPFVRWVGGNRTTKDGVEFFHGSLGLDVQFPTDWLPTAGRNYVLSITASGHTKILNVDILLDEVGCASVDVLTEATRAGWKYGLLRLLSEIRRPNETRILLRSSVLYWHGLQSITPGLRFDCIGLPSNFEPLLSENVDADGSKLKPTNAAMRNLRLVFNLGDKRRQSLSWNVPGVYVEVEGLGDGGAPVRVNRPLGSIEVVSYTSAKQIVISANEPSHLRLGDWSQQVDFARRPSKVLSAAFLASRINAKSNVLVFHNDRTGTELELLTLLQPHSVRRMSAQIQSGQFVLCFSLTDELEGLTIRARELVTGKDVDFALKADANSWTGHPYGRAMLMVVNEEEGGYVAIAHLALDAWPPGAWVFEFSGCIRGVWGHLENARQDIFGAGLLWGEECRAMQSREFLESIASLDDTTSLEFLERVQKALQPCYSQETWDRLKWLDSAWRELVARWHGREAEGGAALIDLAATGTREDAAPSWMLQRVLGASLPGLFALPGTMYCGIREKPHSMSRDLRAIGYVSESYPAVFSDLLHPSSAAGFANFAAVTRGAAPRGFNCQKYSMALLEMDAGENLYRLEDVDFLPERRDYLGPLHYRQAIRALESNYDRSLGGNEIRRGQAIGLCRFVRRVLPTFNGEAIPETLTGQYPHIVPWSTENDDLLPPEVAQRQENLSNVSHLLSWFAFSCRLEARVKGSLNAFIQMLDEAGMSAEESFSYLLQIGSALFTYYLVLWELVLIADKDWGI